MREKKKYGKEKFSDEDTDLTPMKGEETMEELQIR